MQEGAISLKQAALRTRHDLAATGCEALVENLPPRLLKNTLQLKSQMQRSARRGLRKGTNSLKRASHSRSTVLRTKSHP